MIKYLIYTSPEKPEEKSLDEVIDYFVYNVKEKPLIIGLNGNNLLDNLPTPVSKPAFEEILETIEILYENDDVKNATFLLVTHYGNTLKRIREIIDKHDFDPLLSRKVGNREILMIAKHPKFPIYVAFQHLAGQGGGKMLSLLFDKHRNIAGDFKALITDAGTTTWILERLLENKDGYLVMDAFTGGLTSDVVLNTHLIHSNIRLSPFNVLLLVHRQPSEGPSVEEMDARIDLACRLTRLVFDPSGRLGYGVISENVTVVGVTRLHADLGVRLGLLYTLFKELSETLSDRQSKDVIDVLAYVKTNWEDKVVREKTIKLDVSESEELRPRNMLACFGISRVNQKEVIAIIEGVDQRDEKHVTVEAIRQACKDALLPLFKESFVNELSEGKMGTICLCTILFVIKHPDLMLETERFRQVCYTAMESLGITSYRGPVFVSLNSVDDRIYFVAMHILSPLVMLDYHFHELGEYRRTEKTADGTIYYKVQAYMKRIRDDSADFEDGAQSKFRSLLPGYHKILTALFRKYFAWGGPKKTEKLTEKLVGMHTGEEYQTSEKEYEE